MPATRECNTHLILVLLCTCCVSVCYQVYCWACVAGRKGAGTSRGRGCQRHVSALGCMWEALATAMLVW